MMCTPPKDVLSHVDIKGINDIKANSKIEKRKNYLNLQLEM